MLRAIADTHTIIWYIFADSRLSSAARATIRSAQAVGDQIGFSTISLAEIVYLAEKGRIPPLTLQNLLEATAGNKAIFREVPVDRDIVQMMLAVARAQVPDLPDRIITATALHLGLPLISRDRKIQMANVQTIW